MRICIDPGHSGPYEPGAVYDGVTEAELNMSIARYAGDLLTRWGHTVFYTRDGDIDSDLLLPRVKLANRLKADVFVSIHCNAAVSHEASGAEVYHYPGSIDGNRLAAFVNCAIKTRGIPSRGIKTESFYVLEKTAMPAVLVECGFLTSDDDRRRLSFAEGRRIMGEMIAGGVSAYGRHISRRSYGRQVH